tara:strand:+ start:688 stop:912 length:225 start_codon:yes stop_codon:yes gene_type:complete
MFTGPTEDLKPMNPPEHSINIRGIRKTLGLTQEQFASAVGVTGRTIVRWETGKSRPHAVFIRIIQSLSLIGATQ